MQKCLDALEGLAFAEIRLDKMAVAIGDVRNIFSRHSRLIATCRPGEIEDEKRKVFLIEAISAGAAFVDLEVDSEDTFKNEIVRHARARGCRVIVSYHDFERTPKRAELEHVVDWCFETGADIAKIACRVNSTGECALLLGLLHDSRPLVVVGMGRKGRITRIVAPLLGSLFTYASAGEGRETEEGQIDRESLEGIWERLKNVRD